MMDDRMRVSDADRERVTTRLREHFADGRLTSEELDERVTSALNAKTFGDLRAVMADLPEPEPTGPQAGPPPWASGPQWGPPAYRHRRGPRLLPLALLILLAAVILPGGGWIFLGFFKVILLFWLVLCIAGVFAAARFRRRVRRNWQSGRRNWPGDYR
jgi:Domain of unknown function (DUF1707)